MSAFHRVDDIHAMNSLAFLSRATRLFAYGGVLAARWRTEQQGTAPAAPRPASSVPIEGDPGDVDPDVERMRNEVRLKTHPGAGDRIEYVSLGKQLQLQGRG